MEGIAQPGIIQVTEKQLRHHRAVAQVHPSHNGHGLFDVADAVVGMVFVLNAQQAQQQHDGIHRPGRCKPGQILPKNRPVKG